jgi:F420-dependent oxidoreductase-like protein
VRLGVFLSQNGAVPLAVQAERLGYAVALVPEGFKQDAPSLLGALAGVTRRIRLASGVMQIPARTPVMTALTASTVDALCDGRFALGLGVSNPDVSAGWYGVPYDRPLLRTREYVDVVRLALTGRPVRYVGCHIQLPPDGVEEAAQLSATTPRADLPIYLAAVGRRSLELAGEIADGWIGVFCSPERLAESLQHVGTGRARAGRSLDGFEVLPSIPISVADDPVEAAARVRGYFATFIGLGSRRRSIYHRLVTGLGHGAAADEIRAHVRAGDRVAAAKAVPFELVDEVSLLGPMERIAARMARYAAAGVTTLGLTPLATTVAEQTEALRVAAAAAQLAADGVGGKTK